MDANQNKEINILFIYYLFIVMSYDDRSTYITKCVTCVLHVSKTCNTCVVVVVLHM